jgi:type IV pilus assembly protein PilE
MVMKNGLRVTGGRIRRNGGVTLLELMIVVVVVGILAAIAYPSFQDQVRKTRRADGKAALLDTAQQLERCYTRFASYTAAAGCVIAGALPFNSPEDSYTISGVLAASTFTLSATPQGNQANDVQCGTLTLSNTGVQGADGDADVCW